MSEPLQDNTSDTSDITPDNEELESEGAQMDSVNADSESSDDDSEESEKERNSKELLTREKVASLMDGDPLENVVVGIFDQIVSNVETGKGAAKANTDSYAAALKEYQDTSPDEFAAWHKEDDQLQSTLEALRQKIADHKSVLTAKVEPFRKVADVDLGSVNERHRKMKVSLFNFLTAAGVSDADTTYRVPELPTSVRVTSGWSPRLSKVTVNGTDIQFTGDNPTLTDLNKALGIKGEQGQGARWAELFGTRDVPTGGLSVNRTINGKNFRVVIFPRSS